MKQGNFENGRKGFGQPETHERNQPLLSVLHQRMDPIVEEYLERKRSGSEQVVFPTLRLQTRDGSLVSIYASKDQRGIFVNPRYDLYGDRHLLDAAAYRISVETPPRNEYVVVSDDTASQPFSEPRNVQYSVYEKPEGSHVYDETSFESREPIDAEDSERLLALVRDGAVLEAGLPSHPLAPSPMPGLRMPDGQIVRPEPGQTIWIP